MRLRPGVVDGRGPPARGREIEGGDRPAVPPQHFARSRADGEVRLGPLGTDASVHLRARVGVEVEVLARLQRREGVGAGGNSLRLIGRLVPALRHLPRDDAAQVAVERQQVDDHQTGGRALDDHVAAVRREVDLQRLGPRLKAKWRPQHLVPERELPVDDDGPRRQVQLVAACVENDERRGRSDPNGVASPREEHAHRPRVPRLDRRLRVVVREDLAVAETVARVALGAPLAHADPVAPAATVEQEHGPCRRHCRNREGGQDDCKSDPHRGSAA
jgi:hypothetical protein